MLAILLLQLTLCHFKSSTAQRHTFMNVIEEDLANNKLDYNSVNTKTGVTTVKRKMLTFQFDQLSSFVADSTVSVELVFKLPASSSEERMFLYFKNQTTYQLINPIKLDTEKQWQQHQIPLDLLKNKALIKFVIFGDSFHKNIADYQPLLVGFENEDEKIHQMSFPEVVMKEEAVRSPKSKRDVADNMSTSTRSEMPCSRHNLYINFEKENVLPKEINIFQCGGNCEEPFYRSDATVHARLQAAMHARSPDTQNGPCCVPIRHQPLTVVIVVGDQTKFKTYKNAIATQCGCR